MRFSILHLSDLHRDLDEEVRNDWLLESLERDLERYEDQNPSIPRPSLCILTGDLVFGVKPDAVGGKAELVRQYAQAEEFLAGLADRLFHGDRERIVILPGNHDVSYADVMSSVQRIEVPSTAENARLVAELFRPHSRLRWSWSDMCFFRITDESAYNGKFTLFAEFYARFYRGRRTFPLEPELQQNVFDFPDLGFCVLALNSAFDNDPLHRTGDLHPGCVAEG